MLGLPCPLLDLFVMPPKGDGPWALDKVKQRLRAEQVDRERAAAARYRRQEERGERQENSLALQVHLSALYRSTAGSERGFGIRSTEE